MEKQMFPCVNKRNLMVFLKTFFKYSFENIPQEDLVTIVGCYSFWTKFTCGNFDSLQRIEIDKSRWLNEKKYYVYKARIGLQNIKLVVLRPQYGMIKNENEIIYHVECRYV